MSRKKTTFEIDIASKVDEIGAKEAVRRLAEALRQSELEDDHSFVGEDGVRYSCDRTDCYCDGLKPGENCRNWKAIEQRPAEVTADGYKVAKVSIDSVPRRPEATPVVKIRPESTEPCPVDTGYSAECLECGRFSECRFSGAAQRRSEATLVETTEPTIYGHSAGCLNVAECAANGCKMLEDEEWADRPTPDDEAIQAVFPTRSNRHDLYREAQRLVGARHGKFALLAMVNWLLHRIEQAEQRRAAPSPIEQPQRETCSCCQAIREVLTEAGVDASDTNIQPAVLVRRALAASRDAGWNAAIDEAAELFEDTDWLDESAMPGESFPRCARMVRALRNPGRAAAKTGGSDG